MNHGSPRGNTRRKIREATVQLLYARASDPQLKQGQEGPELWELINDTGTLLHDKAQIRALTHLQQGRVASVTRMSEILPDIASALAAADPSGKLARDLSAHVQAETKWAESVGNVSRLAKAETGGWRRDLAKLLDENTTIHNRRMTLVERLSPVPPNTLAGLRKELRKLDTYDERARMVHFPENAPEHPILRPLNDLRAGMDELESESADRANQIETALEEIDPLIATSTENFSFQRISRVDLAILRLATWEILKVPELDSAISINEAVELARSFSGEDSARFVNGVLDQIAKTAAS